MAKISITNPNSSSSILTIALLVIVLSIGSLSALGFSREFGIVRLKQLGGETPNFSNSDEFESIAHFAVQEYNKRENALLKLGRVLTAKEQVVAGKLYHLTFEAVDAGKKAVYEAKVWVKPWINFKKLEEFKHVMDSPHFTTSDLGFVQDVLGWHKVLVHDPEVQDAAKHAVMGLQNRVNCICKFKLLEILEAEAKVVNNFVNYSLLLKLRMSGRDENYKVNVRKTDKGFLLDGW